MIGWLAVIVAGTVLGVTSDWHGHAGGAGTTGRALPVVLLIVVVVVAGLMGWAGRSR